VQNAQRQSESLELEPLELCSAAATPEYPTASLSRHVAFASTDQRCLLNFRYHFEIPRMEMYSRIIQEHKDTLQGDAARDFVDIYNNLRKPTETEKNTDKINLAQHSIQWLKKIPFDAI